MTKDKEKRISIFKAYLVEIKDRWFSSAKRIVSTIGVFFIPFIYAFTCIAAFWNPLPKIGTVPMSIVSLDKEQLIVTDTDAPADYKEVAIGIPLQYTTSDSLETASWANIPTEYLSSVISWNAFGPVYNPTYIKTQGGSILNYAHTTDDNPAGSATKFSLIDRIMTLWQSGALKSSGLDFDAKKNSFHINVSENYPITNLKYHNIGNSDNLSNWATDADQLASYSNSTWDIKNRNDYVQISIPQDSTTYLVGYLDASMSNMVNPETFMNMFHNNPIDLFLTYEKTFLAPRIINQVIDLFPTLASGVLPMAIGSLVEILVADVTNKIALPYTKGGYSWSPIENIDISGFSWSDHQYTTGTGTVGKVTETARDLHLTKGKWYTLQNEEFRTELLAKLGSDNPNYQILNQTDTDGHHTIPTIEGITVGSEWNPSTSADSKYAFLHKITNISSVLVEIPVIRNAIADAANLVINSNLDKFTDTTGQQYIFSVDIGPNDISKLLKSDQFISGLLMQDARYIIPDVDAPKIPIVVNASLFPVGFDVNVNFGRLIALMCNTGGTLLLPNFQSIFQQVDLRSAYTDDNTDYQTDNTSYHKGSILADLGILGEDYDYAINTPALESFGDKNFNFNNNLSHNYQILLGIATQSFEKTNPDYYVTYTEIGSQYQEYGIGLGAFFICIGMCVGTLTQIMIYDKKKRVRRIRAPKWYRSKTLMMVSTSLIQGSILAFSIGFLGWFMIGHAFVYEWLFILFCGLIFVSIIQSIWFSFRYRALGFFCVVIFLVLNLAAGWGTFPPFTQYEFFNIISHILPFTYMMHAQDAIIYGISTGSNVFANSMEVLKNVGILLIYVVIFNALGTFMSYRRERELYYGTYSRKHLGVVLKKLGYAKYCKTTKKGVTLVDWKKIPHEEMPRVKAQVQMMFPYEKINKKYRSPEIIRDIVDFDNN